MAKKSAIKRNEKLLQKVNKYQEKRSLLLKKSKDKSLSFKERFEAMVRLSELPRNSAASRYRNRCAITGRPRGFYRKFQMSRIALRELAAWGQIPGLTKSSW